MRAFASLVARILRNRSRSRAALRLNLQLSRPELADEKIEVAIDEYAQHAGWALSELLYTSSLTATELLALMTEVDDPQGWLDSTGDRPTIAYYCHGGLLDAVIAALHAKATNTSADYPYGLLVTKTDKRWSFNDLWTQRVNKVDLTGSVTFTDVPGLMQAGKILRSGGAITAAADLLPKSDSQGIASTFGGEPIFIPKIWYQLGKKYQADAVWVWTERLEYLRSYKLHVKPMPPSLFTGSEQNYSDHMRDAIDEVTMSLDTDYWYMGHRRFKRQPNGQSRQY